MLDTAKSPGHVQADPWAKKFRKLSGGSLVRPGCTRPDALLYLEPNEGTCYLLSSCIPEVELCARYLFDNYRYQVELSTLDLQVGASRIPQYDRPILL